MLKTDRVAAPADAVLDREMIRDALRRILARHRTPNKDRSAADRLWPALVEAGFTRIAGCRDLVVLMEELGRASCPEPLLPAVIADTLLPAGMIDPGVRVALACPGLDGDLGGGAVTATGGFLNGTARFVDGAMAASVVLILLDNGARLALVKPDATGLTVTATRGLGGSGLCDLTFHKVAAQIQAIDPARGMASLRAVRLGLAARALGAAQRGCELAVDHAAARQQFGQPIGRFQAVQHKLADSAIALDACRLQIDAAANAIDAGDADAARLGMIAAGFAGPALRRVALETQHVLGAIGYAEEHEAPGLFRRIHEDVARHGGLRTARAELAGLLLDGPPAADGSGEQPEAAAMRDEIRAWLARYWTEQDRALNRARPFEERIWNLEFAAQLGNDGWTTLTWPAAAGGQERSPIEQLAFVEEMQRAEAPDMSTLVGSRILGPEIIAHGSPALRDALLPGIEAGIFSFCLGYSEPEAGSDLASLRTRAVRDGDVYVVNGQKIWTTDGHRASHMILAARTDPDANKRHGGISLFVVPMDTPGIVVRPTMAFYGHPFCNIFFDDVRVSAVSRLGPESGGWPILARALASERVIMGAFATQLDRVLADMIDHVRRTEHRADPFVRDRIAALAMEVDAARRLALRSILLGGGERAPLVEAAMSKVYSSELGERLAGAAIELFGTSATLGESAPEVPLGGRIEELLRRSIMMVVGGGTNEIQRSMIAQRGLGLPR